MWTIKSLILSILAVAVCSFSTHSYAADAKACREALGLTWKILSTHFAENKLGDISTKDDSVFQLVAIQVSLPLTELEDLMDGATEIKSLATTTGLKLHREFLTAKQGESNSQITILVEGSSVGLNQLLRSLQAMPKSRVEAYDLSSMGGLKNLHLSNEIESASRLEEANSKIVNRLNSRSDGAFMINFTEKGLFFVVVPKALFKAKLKNSFETTKASELGTKLAVFSELLLQSEAGEDLAYIMHPQQFGSMQRELAQSNERLTQIPEIIRALIPTGTNVEPLKPAEAEPAKPVEAEPAKLAEAEPAKPAEAEPAKPIVQPESKSMVPAEELSEGTTIITDPNLLAALAGAGARKNESIGATAGVLPTAASQPSSIKISNLADGSTEARVSVSAFLSDRFAFVRNGLRDITDRGRVIVTSNDEAIGILVGPSILTHGNELEERIDTIRAMGNLPDDARLSPAVENFRSWINSDGNLNLFDQKGFLSRGPLDVSQKDIVTVTTSDVKSEPGLLLNTQKTGKPVVFMGAHGRASFIFLPISKPGLKPLLAKPVMPPPSSGTGQTTEGSGAASPAGPIAKVARVQRTKVPFVSLGLGMENSPEQALEPFKAAAAEGRVEIESNGRTMALLATPQMLSQPNALRDFIESWKELTGRMDREIPPAVVEINEWLKPDGATFRKFDQYFPDLIVKTFKKRDQVTMEDILKGIGHDKLIVVKRANGGVAYILWPLTTGERRGGWFAAPKPPAPTVKPAFTGDNTGAPAAALFQKAGNAAASPQALFMRAIEVPSVLAVSPVPPAAPVVAPVSTSVPAQSSLEDDFLEALGGVAQVFEFLTIQELYGDKKEFLSALDQLIRTLSVNDSEAQLREAISGTTKEMQLIASIDLNDRATVAFLLRNFEIKVVEKIQKVQQLVAARIPIAQASLKEPESEPESSSKKHDLSLLRIMGSSPQRREHLLNARKTQKFFDTLSESEFQTLVTSVEMHLGALEQIMNMAFPAKILEKIVKLVSLNSGGNFVSMNGGVDAIYENAPIKNHIIYRRSGNKIYILDVQPAKWVNDIKAHKGQIASRWLDMTGSGK